MYGKIKTFSKYLLQRLSRDTKRSASQALLPVPESSRRPVALHVNDNSENSGAAGQPANPMFRHIPPSIGNRPSRNRSKVNLLTVVWWWPHLVFRVLEDNWKHSIISSLSSSSSGSPFSYLRLRRRKREEYWMLSSARDSFHNRLFQFALCFLVSH